MVDLQLLIVRHRRLLGVVSLLALLVLAACQPGTDGGGADGGGNGY